MAFKLPSFEELNNTQKLIIKLLPNAKKLAVIGGPGTGKTIIAIQAADVMSQSNSKCLILSYSKSLRDQIKCIADTFNLNIDNIEIDSMHAWLWRKLKNLKVADPKILQSHEFTYDICKLKSFLDSIPKSRKLEYDYIFIDEAQDVQDGLIKLLCQFCNHIIVTFDDSQRIGNSEISFYSNDTYNHSNILSDLQIGDKYFDLIDNYRNTIQVESVAKTLFSSYDTNDITLNKITSKKVGKRPKLITSKEYMSYSEIAKYIVNHYDLSKSVAVLFNTNGQKGAMGLFNGLKENIENEIKASGRQINFLFKFGNKTNIDSSNSLDNGIFLMSFKTSKGLEFDEVYVLTTDVEINNYQKRNAFYVAFTRSKTMTYAIIDNLNEVNAEINNLLLSNSFLFDKEEI